MSRPRAIRFSKEEEFAINEFLTKNPFFDFSSLGKLAILQFIQNPSIQIKPVTIDQKEIKKVRSQLNGHA